GQDRRPRSRQVFHADRLREARHYPAPVAGRMGPTLPGQQQSDAARQRVRQPQLGSRQRLLPGDIQPAADPRPGCGFAACQVSGGWDMHNNLEEAMSTRGGEFDQAFTALIQDLESRGLLKSTLVVVTTEFGRKPDFQGTGRGHYPKVFTTVMAGAGIKRGYAH